MKLNNSGTSTCSRYSSSSITITFIRIIVTAFVLFVSNNCIPSSLTSTTIVSTTNAFTFTTKCYYSSSHFFAINNKNNNVPVLVVRRISSLISKSSIVTTSTSISFLKAAQVKAKSSESKIILFSTTPSSSSRRTLLESVVVFIVTVGTSLPATATAIAQQSQSQQTQQPQQRAKGAFELDTEYYIRDLLGGNRKEGTIQQSIPPPQKPPRILSITNTNTYSLIPYLLNDNYTIVSSITSITSIPCIPLQVVDELIKGKQFKQISKPTYSIESIGQMSNIVRDKVSRSFYSRSSWYNETIMDQYYFDVSIYSLWKVLSDTILIYSIDRDLYIRTIGQRLYTLIVDKQQQQQQLQSSTSGRTTNRSIVDCQNSILTVLQAFMSSNYCTGFKVTTTDNDEMSTITNNDLIVGTNTLTKNNKNKYIFDTYDDTIINNGGTINILISIYEPITLGSCLQLVGEQIRFIPDFIGPTIAAAINNNNSIDTNQNTNVYYNVLWESYFVDPIYRSNPKDYYPIELLLQYSISLV